MLLLTGPPGSGKSYRILHEIRTLLRSGLTDFRLVVPAATMAGHLRHQLAREGFALRPGVIVTLAQFLDRWVDHSPEISPAMLELAIERVLLRHAHGPFARVAHLPGFRAALASLINELSSAGCDSHRLAKTLDAHPIEGPLAGPFLEIFEQTERELFRRGWSLRSHRLKSATREIEAAGLGGISQVFFDGFSSLGALELNLVDAIRAYAGVTIALPRWRGSEAARTVLLGMGFREETLPEACRRQPHVTLVAAPTLEQEVDEVARRIVEQAAAGRPFREIGILLRSRGPYVPALRAAFERFGIPARFYFSEPLAAHPVVQFLAGLVDVMRGGWDHSETLELLKMGASGYGGRDAADRLDFALRQALPGRGLAAIRELSGDPRLHVLLDRWSQLDEWSARRELPEDWAKRARGLAALAAPPPIDDGVSQETVARWRAQAAALEAFGCAMDEAASTLPPGEPAAFSEFWDAALVVLRGAVLRPRDARCNVVHVMDVYEARQWELPVTFVCGLLERQFPLYHPGDPILPDPARAQLQRAGIPLKTAEDWQREEEFLFEIAATRATGELLLTWPEFNEKGEPNLRSFFLRRFALDPVKARPARPRPARAAVHPPRLAYIQDPAILEAIRERSQVLRPTDIETFLQCPFLYFLSRTLGLIDPPPRPAERLDARVQGAIIHRALAEFADGKGPIEDVFGRVFAEVCRKERVLDGCRAELARVRMLRDLRQFAAQTTKLEGWKAAVEQPIEFDLADGLSIHGRIDQYEVSSDRRAVVFEFKYSGPQRIRDRIRGCEDGEVVQAALYLLGLAEKFGYTPAGMFYCGLRGAVTIDGWHTNLPGFERTGISCTPEALCEQLEAARAAAVNAAAEIRRGRVEPPAEAAACEFCGFGDACRQAAASMGGGA
jgi:RecB family exonuclease